MKKTILATLAIASMMSCSNEELLEAPAQQAITFGNTFVENAPRTRAAYDGSYNNTNNSLTQFQVYGTITNKDNQSGNIFNGNDVLFNGKAWNYTGGLNYWIPGNTYNFAATVHGSEDAAISTDFNSVGMPTTIQVDDASVQKDLLYAQFGPVAHGTTPWGEVVAFTFNHLLSKAKFTVKNAVETNSGYSYKVSGITITTDKNGVYNVAEGTWSAAATPATYELSFGNAVTEGTEKGDAEPVAIGYDSQAESNYERLLIPNEYKADGSKKLTVTFTCVTHIGTTVLRTETKEVTTQKDVVLEKGKAYNFIISLGNPGEKIQFTVEKINDWETNHEGYNTGVEIK